MGGCVSKRETFPVRPSEFLVRKIHQPIGIGAYTPYMGIYVAQARSNQDLSPRPQFCWTRAPQRKTPPPGSRGQNAQTCGGERNRARNRVEKATQWYPGPTIDHVTHDFTLQDRVSILLNLGILQISTHIKQSQVHCIVSLQNGRPVV